MLQSVVMTTVKTKWNALYLWPLTTCEVSLNFFYISELIRQSDNSYDQYYLLLHFWCHITFICISRWHPPQFLEVSQLWMQITWEPEVIWSKNHQRHSFFFYNVLELSIFHSRSTCFLGKLSLLSLKRGEVHQKYENAAIGYVIMTSPLFFIPFQNYHSSGHCTIVTQSWI